MGAVERLARMSLHDALNWPAQTSSHRLSQMTHPNDLPKPVYMDALKRPTRMSLHRHPQTTRLNKFTQMTSNDPPKWPTWMSWHGSPQTTHLNEFTWAPTRPKRRHKGEARKWAIGTCTKLTTSHNLAFLIQARVLRRTLTLNDPTKWVYMNALKWPFFLHFDRVGTHVNLFGQVVW